MFPVSAIGTPNNMLGIISTGVPTVFVGGVPIAVMGMSLVTPHPGIPPKVPHPPNPLLLNCSVTVRAMAMPVAHVGSIDTCMHVSLPHPNPMVSTVRVGL
jgi:hypothetical protein